MLAEYNDEEENTSGSSHDIPGIEKQNKTEKTEIIVRHESGTV